LLKASEIKKPITYCFLTSVLSVTLLLPPCIVSAQPDHILFDHYTTEDGLANNTIWEICKSRKGFIWLGTQDGLCRFDGKNFKTYRFSATDSNTLSHNTVYKLLEDDLGYIWAGTFSGLNRYNPGTNNITRIKNGDYLTHEGGNVGIGAIAQERSDKWPFFC
jgi:ligand-binding sensor domain-containing protein